MSAPSVTLCTIAEANAFDRFRALELAMCAATPVTADEMIEVLLAERHRQEVSAHTAERVYGAPFHSVIVRRCAVFGKAADFLGLIQQHRDEVMPILRGAAAKRGRRA